MQNNKSIKIKNKKIENKIQAINIWKIISHTQREREREKFV